jgi:alkyl sulfatase BDS1-like metallo-beta-lactamase superfamily hydrolase
VARFLSDEWFDEVNAAAVPVDPSVRFCLEQRVRGGTEGEVRYRVVVSDGRLQLRRTGTTETCPAPDAVITMDRTTAVALATGTMTAHTAFLAGAVRLSGNLQSVVGSAAALGALSEALRRLAERTTY